MCVCVCVCDRGFSMFSNRKDAESSGFFCSDIFLGGWLSFEPIFEVLIALEVPQRAYRPPLCTCTTPGHCLENDHRSTHSTREAKNWSFWVQTGSLEHLAILAFFLDRGFSQRPRPVSLWNEVPRTLIARRWPCAFFSSDCYM